jgi:hypothetical protein
MVPFHWLTEAPPFMGTLRALDTFNHDRCDAFLTAHGIDIMGIFPQANDLHLGMLRISTSGYLSRSKLVLLRSPGLS